MNVEGNNIIFTASDGYRVARYTENIHNEDYFECIIPRNTLSIISAMKFEGDIEICVNDNWITITDNGQYKVVHSRLIDGDYLNVGSILSAENELEYELSRSLIISVIDRAKVVAGRVSEIKVTFENEDGSIGYSGEDEYFEAFKLLKGNERKSLKFINLNYLRDAVAAMSADRIYLHTNISEKTPLIFKDDKVESLVLPISKRS